MPRLFAEGEAVEFRLTTDPKTGKIKAVDVTGPDGAYVQGAPRAAWPCASPSAASATSTYVREGMPAASRCSSVRHSVRAANAAAPSNASLACARARQ